jgi:hypothetical protein
VSQRRREFIVIERLACQAERIEAVLDCLCRHVSSIGRRELHQPAALTTALGDGAGTIRCGSKGHI